jgi:ATP adenylyltransferase
VPHEQLWAPWRLGYIAGTDRPTQKADSELSFLPGADRGCFMCRAIADNAAADRENLLVARGERTMAILNRYPYNNGHLLVAPARHVAVLGDLDDAEHLSIQRELARFVGVLEKAIDAEGFNVGLNLGRVAGAGVPGHLHWHIVPRWAGDTNFMSSVDAVRVIPQALEAMWDHLSAGSGEVGSG